MAIKERTTVTVSNRVYLILSLFQSLCWQYCPQKANAPQILKEQRGGCKKDIGLVLITSSSRQDIGKLVFLKALFQTKGEVYPVHNANDDGLPGNQVSQPIKQLPVQNMRLFPAARTKVKKKKSSNIAPWWLSALSLIHLCKIRATACKKCINLKVIISY